jgi:hypothetical protein
LCSEKALKGESDKCLDEPFPSLLSKEEKPKPPKKKKGKKEDKQPKDNPDTSNVASDTRHSDEPVPVQGKEEL